MHFKRSSKFDENLAVRSQFDCDHRVNLYAPTCCLSVTFVPPLFAFVLCFLQKKIIINFATFCYVVFTLIARWCHCRLLKIHNYAQLRTMVDFIVLSIKLVFMVLGISYSRVLAQRPTGCFSASKVLKLYETYIVVPRLV